MTRRYFGPEEEAALERWAETDLTANAVRDEMKRETGIYRNASSIDSRLRKLRKAAKA